MTTRRDFFRLLVGAAVAPLATKLLPAKGSTKVSLPAGGFLPPGSDREIAAMVEDLFPVETPLHRVIDTVAFYETDFGMVGPFDSQVYLDGPRYQARSHCGRRKQLMREILSRPRPAPEWDAMMRRTFAQLKQAGVI